jgi:hypothetical protein
MQASHTLISVVDLLSFLFTVMRNNSEVVRRLRLHYYAQVLFHRHKNKDHIGKNGILWSTEIDKKGNIKYADKRYMDIRI